MKTSLFHSVLGAVAIATTFSTAAGQSGRSLAQRLDSLAGSGVLENRSVGIVAAVVKGNDTTQLRFSMPGGHYILKKQ